MKSFALELALIAVIGLALATAAEWLLPAQVARHETWLVFVIAVTAVVGGRVGVMLLNKRSARILAERSGR